MNAEQRQPQPTDAQLDQRSKKLRRWVLGGSIATVALCAPTAIFAIRAGEDHSESIPSVAPRTETSQTVTEVPTVSPSFPPLPEAVSMLPSIDVSTSPSFNPDQVPSSVLDVVPQVGQLTFSGGLDVNKPYASGVVIGSNQFLTSADLFGAEPKDPKVKCGEYNGTIYSYKFTTVSEHKVISIKRHPDSKVDLAIATVAEPFNTTESSAKIAPEATTSGMVYDINYQTRTDGSSRSPSTGAHIFEGQLVNSTIIRQVKNAYYPSQDRKVEVVGTFKENGFNPQTGMADLNEEGYAGDKGSGGPLVTPAGEVAALQTAYTDSALQQKGFLATPVTQTEIDAIQAAPDDTTQKC